MKLILNRYLIYKLHPVKTRIAHQPTTWTSGGHIQSGVPVYAFIELVQSEWQFIYT